jgi:hypothetical protein
VVGARPCRATAPNYGGGPNFIDMNDQIRRESVKEKWRNDMTNLNEWELMIVAGGVTQSPDGKTCTDPRDDNDDLIKSGPDIVDILLDGFPNPLN